MHYLASSKSLGLGAVIGIAIALWSGVRGMTGMMTALNIAHAQPERRDTTVGLPFPTNQRGPEDADTVVR